MIRESGYTLIELMMTIAILALVASFAGPSVNDYIDKRKIINAAEAVYSQLQFARSQAISRSEDVHVNFGYSDATDAATWLMGVSTNETCELDPSGDTVDENGVPQLPDAANNCTLVVDDGDGVIHGVDGNDVDDLTYHVLAGADFNSIELDADGTGSGGAPNEITFNSTRGTAERETIFLFYSAGGRQYEMRVVIGIIGRVRICTPDDDKAVPGYTTCT